MVSFSPKIPGNPEILSTLASESLIKVERKILNTEAGAKLTSFRSELEAIKYGLEKEDFRGYNEVQWWVLIYVLRKLLSYSCKLGRLGWIRKGEHSGNHTPKALGDWRENKFPLISWLEKSWFWFAFAWLVTAIFSYIYYLFAFSIW